MVATTLQVSTSHHSRTAGRVGKMSICISHNDLMANFFVKIVSAPCKKEDSELTPGRNPSQLAYSYHLATKSYRQLN